MSLFVSNVVKDLFDKTQAKLGTEMFYDFGHYVEVAGKLTEKGRQLDKPNKFPLLWLVMDAEEKRFPDGSDFLYADISVHILIAMDTKPEYTAKEREELIFGPILNPIYDEFIRQVQSSKYLQNSLPSSMSHSKWNRYYWGGQDANGNSTANLFNDHIDAIQIKGLKLRIKKQYCQTFSI
jgi:hypothetical protein